MASPKEKIKKFFRDLKKNEDVTVRRILKGARTAAKNVMNDLAERGPEYSGIFKAVSYTHLTLPTTPYV